MEGCLVDGNRERSNRRRSCLIHLLSPSASLSAHTDQAFKATNRFQWPEAEKAWTKVIELDPQNAAAYSNRGNTRTSMGKCVEAVADFDKAIGLASQEPDPNLGRGVARECLGQFQQALEVGQQALELRPGSCR